MANERPVSVGYTSTRVGQTVSSSQEVLSDQTSEENLRERRYLWTARAFAVVSAVSLVTNLVLIFALFSLVPLTRVQPFLLTFEDKNAQIVRINPMSATPQQLDYITESLVRQYVVLRNAIVYDTDEMLSRWNDQGPIRWMSTNGLYSQFVPTTQEAFSRIREDGLTRDVTILSAFRQATDPKGDIWVVEMETTEMVSDAPEPVVKQWVVTLRVGYERKNEKWEFRRKNPMGFTVKEYSVRPKGDMSL